MKRRDFLKLSAIAAGAAMTVYLPAGWTPAKAAAKVSAIKPAIMGAPETAPL